MQYTRKGRVDHFFVNAGVLILSITHIALWASHCSQYCVFIISFNSESDRITALLISILYVEEETELRRVK